jgi:hypothetical protein
MRNLDGRMTGQMDGKEDQHRTDRHHRYYYVGDIIYGLSYIHDAYNRFFDLSRKLSRRKGASAWFHGVWTCCGVEVLKSYILIHLVLVIFLFVTRRSVTKAFSMI